MIPFTKSRPKLAYRNTLTIAASSAAFEAANLDHSDYHDVNGVKVFICYRVSPCLRYRVRPVRDWPQTADWGSILRRLEATGQPFSVVVYNFKGTEEDQWKLTIPNVHVVKDLTYVDDLLGLAVDWLDVSVLDHELSRELATLEEEPTATPCPWAANGYR